MCFFIPANEKNESFFCLCPLDNVLLLSPMNNNNNEIYNINCRQNIASSHKWPTHRYPEETGWVRLHGSVWHERRRPSRAGKMFYSFNYLWMCKILTHHNNKEKLRR